MNDPRTAARSLWSRLISGETLDEAELQKLIDLVQQDSSLRGAIESDANLHALLRSVTEVQQTADQFVHSVLERCDSLDHSIQSTENENRTYRKVAPGSDAVHAIDEVSEATSVNGTSTPRAANPSGQSGGAYRKRRQSSTWAAIGLTAAVFAGLGLVVWTLSGPLSSQSGSNLAEGVVQGPPVEQSGQPEPGATNDDSSSNMNQDLPSAAPIVSDSTNAIPPNPDKGEFPVPTLVEAPQMKPNIPSEGPVNRPDSESQSHFVTLTKMDDPVWERKGMVGDRLGDEIVRLFAGSVELTFDQGAVVTVNGPVQFRPMSTGQLELRRGRLLASVPQKAIGFTVSTPTSRIVDLGTEFEVAVNEAGESDVQVLKGEVEVAPIVLAGDTSQKWRLLPSKFDRASFFARPRLQGPTPVSASLRGPRGQFQGFVSLNGQTAELSSPEAFDNVRRRAEAELARSQENALRQWKSFVDSMQNNMQGTMNMNGQEMPFGNLQDVMRMQQQMLENVQKSSGNSGESGFSGSINVNGKIITFKTREEYEAARQAAFGPAATFGIGDVLGNDSESR